jgi:hypothetical protein
MKPDPVAQKALNAVAEKHSQPQHCPADCECRTATVAYARGYEHGARDWRRATPEPQAAPPSSEPDLFAVTPCRRMVMDKEGSVARDARRLLHRYGACISVIDGMDAAEQIDMARTLIRTAVSERPAHLKKLLAATPEPQAGGSAMRPSEWKPSPARLERYVMCPRPCDYMGVEWLYHGESEAHGCCTKCGYTWTHKLTGEEAHAATVAFRSTPEPQAAPVTTTVQPAPPYQCEWEFDPEPQPAPPSQCTCLCNYVCPMHAAQPIRERTYGSAAPPAAAPGLVERLERGALKMGENGWYWEADLMLEAAAALRAAVPQAGEIREPEFVISAGAFDHDGEPAITFAAHLSDPRSHAYRAWQHGNPDYLPVWIGTPSGGAEHNESED